MLSLWWVGSYYPKLYVLFGKPKSGSLDSRIDDPNSSKSAFSLFSKPLLNTTHKAVLDFIISYAEGDHEPFLTVTVFNYLILGLLDSAATNTTRS